MGIQISDHFNYKKLIRFTLPSIVMMIFTSIYGIVDGIFVSNFIGKTAFASINMIYPFVMICGAFGFMIGSGGNALIAKTLGEGNLQKANNIFSMLVFVTFIMGIILAIIGLVFIKRISIMLGADNQMLEYCVKYGRFLIAALPFFMLQNVFQSFLVTAGKPHLGLWIMIAAGVTNMALDALFIAVFNWGLIGAACATVISQIVGGTIPFFYFKRENNSILHLESFILDKYALLKTCTNGISEFITNISLSFVSMLYNLQLMKFAGEDGVAAYGVIMYVNFIFLAIYLGYSMSSSPIVSYHYGAKNNNELKNLLHKSLILLCSTSVIITVVAEFMALPIAKIFVSYDEGLLNLTRRAFMIYSLSFLLSHINIFGSAFFTALNNGFISALISILRVLVFESAAVLLLPLWFGIDGIWFSIVVAEMCSVFFTVAIFIKMKARYNY